MAKVLFIPFRLVGSLLAGFAARQAFAKVWGMIDPEEPPEPEHREVSAGKVVLAQALQAAVFAGVAAAFDRGARRVFFYLLGAWPGKERPAPE